MKSRHLDKQFFAGYNFYIEKIMYISWFENVYKPSEIINELGSRRLFEAKQLQLFLACSRLVLFSNLLLSIKYINI